MTAILGINLCVKVRVSEWWDAVTRTGGEARSEDVLDDDGWV